MEGSCVVGVGTAVVCRSIHEQEGEALAEVWLNSEPSDLSLVYDAAIAFPSGTLRLGDAGNEEAVSVAVAPGPWRVRVFVDDEWEPERVVFALSERA
jgi:hypothetical protein